MAILVGERRIIMPHIIVFPIALAMLAVVLAIIGRNWKKFHHSNKDRYEYLKHKPSPLSADEIEELHHLHDTHRTRT